MSFVMKLALHGKEVNEVALESGREYTFGRGSDCDVKLEDQPGISRVHFRIFEDNGAWTVQVMSKFGDIIHAGHPVQTLALESGSVFKLSGYDFRFHEAQQTAAYEAEPMQFAVGQSESSASSNLPARITSAPMHFEGSEDATNVISTSAGVPYARIVEGSGREETVKLGNGKWIAGRESGSQILLNDKKASRRQFEIVTSAQGCFVRDLGSSNGTQLNGVPLAPDELKPIRSGDAIQVGKLVVHFEVRDPHFEKRLMVVPSEVLSAMPVMQEQQPQFEMINYPVPSGPGGAVRVDGGGFNAPAPYSGQNQGQYNDPGAWANDAGPSPEAKKKKLILYGIIGALVLGGAWLSQSSEPPPPKKIDKALVATNDAFSKLSPQKQQQVKAMFIAAKNLFMQGKHGLADEQLRKLHELIPEGYENSIAIAEECRAQAEQERNRLAAEVELRQAAENRAIVEKNLRECEKIANSSFNSDELRRCLAPTFERDPNNPHVREYLSRVEMRVNAKNAKAASQKDYGIRVSNGRALYDKALKLDQKGDVFGAIDAYRKHLANSSPDPDGLKLKSKASVESLTKGVSSRVKESVALAEAAYAQQNYKEAIVQIKRAKNLDPGNNEAAELNARLQRDLKLKLRNMYEEAIIAEGLGQITQARAEWTKIIQMDHPDGDYYKKAKNKLRIYGPGTDATQVR